MGLFSLLSKKLRNRRVPDALSSRGLQKLQKASYTHKIGYGVSGEIFRTQYKNKECVLKILCDTRKLETIQMEIKRLMELEGAGGAPLVLAHTKLYYRPGKPVGVILSFRGDKTLEKALDEKQFSDRQLLELCVDLTKKLQRVQSKNLVHNDLKSDNIMVTTDCNGNPQAHIINYGLGVPVGYSLGLKGFSPNDCCWMAPEVVLGGSSLIQSDVYSLGYCLREISGKMIAPPDSLIDASEKAMHTDPHQRPTISLMFAQLKDVLINN